VTGRLVGVLAGKLALVTGGSRGIGRAIVERLAGDGAAVVFSFVRNQTAAEEVVTAVQAAGGMALAVRADLGRLVEVRRLFDQAEQHLGGLDILVNNASVVATASFAEATEEDYDRVMAVNAKGTFFAIQQAARRLRDGGRIVNLSTVNTVLPAPGVAIYAASTAGRGRIRTPRDTQRDRNSIWLGSYVEAPPPRLASTPAVISSAQPHDRVTPAPPWP
jgi:3-oxoacyl-[acyl-carrier protein] reductase